MSARSKDAEEMNRGTAGVTAHDVTLRKLIAAKARFLAPMIVIYMVGYIGVTALAGFAKGFMGMKVVGSLNVGFALIALNYALAWVLALIYVRVSNKIFDPMVAQVVAGTKSHGERR